MSDSLATEDSYKVATGTARWSVFGDAGKMSELAPPDETDYSDASTSPTQRRYHMRSSTSLRVWLLVAATACVEAVILSSLSVLNQNQHLVTALYGLIFGQVGVACIWLVFSDTLLGRRVLVAALAISLSALAMLRAEPPMTFWISLAVIVADALAVCTVLWIYRATSYRSARTTARQYSLTHLFVLTTIVAILAALLGAAKMLHETWLFTTAFLANNALMALGSVLFWQQRWARIGRLAATIVAALVSGWAVSLTRPHLSGDLETINLLQVTLIAIWLEFGQIIPRYSSAGMPTREAA
jgi:hypothetical protein